MISVKNLLKEHIDVQKEEKMFLNVYINDTATTEIYTLSLHDALPISNEKEECLYRKI